ncbi:MAG: hypothetical protein M3Z21_05550, partial [Pseudomonadota bacterium]|nr:hypothetical protein [Pseudomonadota bacterium]
MSDPTPYACRTLDCPMAGVDIPPAAAAQAGFRCWLCQQPLQTRDEAPAPADAPQWPPGLAPADLPTYLAHPWAAYWLERHPRLKLLWLIEAAEVAVRWSTAVVLAEVLHGHGGDLPETVAASVREHVERPTLGRWLMILAALSRERPARPPLAPAVFDLSAAVFAPRFRTQAHGGTAADSLLVLRNQVVHGGGLSWAAADALAQAHRDGFHKLLRRVAEATAPAETIAVRHHEARRLRGLTPEPIPLPEALAGAGDGVWLTAAGDRRRLFPLLDYGPVRRLGDGGQLTALPGDAAAQVYFRSDRQRLSYLPLGRDEALSENADVAAFRALFRLDEAPRRPA